MVSLTTSERERFAVWLMQEAEADDRLAEQMTKIGIELGAKRYRILAAAAQVIANKLTSTEEVKL